MDSKMNLFKLPIFILMWVGFTLINIPSIILGVFVIPVMWRLRSNNYNTLPWWTKPWANPEDWEGGPQSFQNSLPGWWVNKKGIGFWSFWWYHAIRNPSNGLRSFEWLDLDIDKNKVKYITPKYWRYYAPWEMRKTSEKTVMYLCWQGWKAGTQIIHLWPDTPKWLVRWFKFTPGARHFNLKLGWRIQPSDAIVGPDPRGIRSKDAGFATKLLVYRKG